MPYRFTWYPTPLDGAVVTLTPDGGGPLVGSATTDDNGRPCHICQVPDATATGHGAQLDQTAPGHLPQRLRGILALMGDGQARLAVDDCTLAAEPEAPAPTPPPQTGGDPQTIINNVYATGQFNLATHDGCGTFTEACLAALMAQASPMWGHILKTPGQNQYEGHAIDALMLLAGEGNGIFDIIQSSVSPEAKPQYIRQGDPDPNLWYQPGTQYTLLAFPRHK